MGTISFPKDHTTANISDKLMDLRLEFGLYPKSSDGRTSQCPDAVRLDKLLYFTLEHRLDKPMLTSDRGSNVLAGAEKYELWDWNRCVCHLLEHNFLSCFEGAYDRVLFGTLDDIDTQILLQPECMEPVQADVAANAKSGGRQR